MVGFQPVASAHNAQKDTATICEDVLCKPAGVPRQAEESTRRESLGIENTSNSVELSDSLKFQIVVETLRNWARIVRNRCVPVCGHRAGQLGLGLALL